MTLSILKLVSLCTCLISGTIASAGAILKEIDDLRLPSESVRITFDILTSDGDQTSFQSDQNGKGSSLATVTSRGNRGEKYLFTPKGLWLFAPGSRRTIRIPKIQSLRGETVVGDITQMRFSDEYTLESQTNDVRNGANLIKLTLKAKKRSSTFRRVDLWVSPNKPVPIYAEYFLTSGKLFRTANFGPIKRIPFGGGKIDGITKIEFRSERGKKTVLNIRNMEAQSFRASHFSPNALSR